MIVNVHERKLPASPEQVGALLDRLFGPEDCLWPAERWPMHRSGELRIGAACHQTPSCRTEVSHLVPAEYRFRVKAIVSGPLTRLIGTGAKRYLRSPRAVVGQRRRTRASRGARVRLPLTSRVRKPITLSPVPSFAARARHCTSVLTER